MLPSFASHSLPQGFFVEPTIAEVSSTASVLQEEVFAPIMYVIKIGSVEEGIRINNDVPQVGGCAASRRREACAANYYL